MDRRVVMASLPPRTTSLKTCRRKALVHAMDLSRQSTAIASADQCEPAESRPVDRQVGNPSYEMGPYDKFENLSVKKPRPWAQSLFHPLSQPIDRP